MTTWDWSDIPRLLLIIIGSGILGYARWLWKIQKGD